MRKAGFPSRPPFKSNANCGRISSRGATCFHESSTRFCGTSPAYAAATAMRRLAADKEARTFEVIMRGEKFLGRRLTGETVTASPHDHVSASSDVRPDADRIRRVQPVHVKYAVIQQRCSADGAPPPMTCR